ncbi:hypothetical protein CVT24_001210, partial [Panaeolus cyanescens]
NEAVQQGLVPAASFAFCNIDKVLYSGWAGQKTPNDPKSPAIDRDSVFWMCSQSKLVITLALLQVLETGKIGYDTPVETIIPELKNPVIVHDITASPPTYRAATKTVLMRHLLNHTSGLAYRLCERASPDGLTTAYTSSCYGGEHTVAKFFELIKGGLPSVPLAFEPGDDWAYGWGCDIATFVVERITGRSIEAYCQEHIFGPLGMDTTYYLTSTVKSRLVDLAIRQPQDRTLKKWEGYPAGKAFKPIISQEVATRLFEPTLEPHAVKPIEDFTTWPHLQFGHGLCLNTEDWPGRRRKGSGFWYGWAGTYYFIDPTTGIAASFNAQVIPTKDLEVYHLWERLEEAVYSALV